MGNKVIKHCSNYGYDPKYPTLPPEVLEPDKTKNISQLSQKELWQMLSRLRDETEIQRVIRELKRNSGEIDTIEEPFKIDTKTPINQLYHYGMKGQKWGVRQFQNADGTRTPTGKKRDGEDQSTKRKVTDDLSNDELRKLNERLQLEDTYKKLTSEKITKAESWVQQSIKTAGKQALTEVSKNILMGSAKILVKEISPQFAEVAFDTKKKK